MTDTPDTSCVVVTGVADGDVGELAAGLAEHGIVVVAAAAEVKGAAEAFASADLDVVLHCMCAIPEEGADTYLELLRGEIADIRRHTAAPVILLAEEDHPGLVDTANQAGVDDVIVWPALTSLAFAVAKAKRLRPVEAPAAPAEHVSAGSTRPVYTVFSPKGGTGKTVLSTNLAATLATRRKERVLLVDLDLQFGDAAIMLGIDPKRTMADLVIDGGELDAGKLAGYVTRHPVGFDILAAPLKPEQAELVTESLVKRILEVAVQAYDTVVVDTSPFFYGPMIALLDHTDELLVVSSPDVPTLKNVRLSLQTLSRLGFPAEKTSVVLSRARDGVGITRTDVEEALGTPVRFEIPDDVVVATSVNRGTPPVVLHADSGFAVAIRAIEAELRGEPTASASHPSTSRASRMRRLTVPRRLLERRA